MGTINISVRNVDSKIWKQLKKFAKENKLKMGTALTIALKIGLEQLKLQNLKYRDLS